VGALAIASWTVYQWNAGSPGDYISAEKAFNELASEGPSARKETLLKLQKILKQHPELHAKYDGRIAQNLLLSSHQGLAASFSKATERRIGDISPYYKQFSNCSLLISEKKFADALTLSQSLKQSLDQDELFWKTKSEIVRHGAVLYGYNLLRIASLQQMTGNAAGELEAWSAFKKAAGWLDSEASLDPESFALISQNFQHNDVSLKDFIQYRETLLQGK
jgi:hypothetical protein